MVSLAKWLSVCLIPEQALIALVRNDAIDHRCGHNLTDRCVPSAELYEAVNRLCASFSFMGEKNQKIMNDGERDGVLPVIGQDRARFHEMNEAKRRQAQRGCSLWGQR